MSVGLNYQSWVSARPTERRARTVPLRARATASAAMRAVALSDAVLLVVVSAALGLSLATWWTWVAMATAVGALALTGHYRPRITLSVAREAGSIVACAMAPFLVLALARVPGPSTARLIVTGSIVAGSIIIARCATYWVVRLMRARGWFARADPVRRGRRRQHQDGGDARRAS